MASTTSGDVVPSGCAIFTSIPDLFFIPEFVFGSLVWILVASTRVYPDNPLGWVMFVSVFCCLFTTLWFFFSLCGANQSDVWPALDTGYHFLAAVFYLSASVILAYVTVLKGWGVTVDSRGVVNLVPLVGEGLKIYRLDIAAVVMSHVSTLLYFLHAIFSAIRWKRA
ncbi:myelin and lymphocyte protein-like isoform X2 [Syngnathoides biaculeatus]|uniref:myelin and lymphocyte protein-like isoform X2 n=1 Tax=Syngnathoides biaculeatus TaxID=300417 RepID=UPI002ADD6564|nr:myelin and lymphocyte protein-like isoform X2 [Syngnathoides biaculeatus]